ncbi:hypothetical protein [Pinibacter aurantiacus]|uniref:Uncharacterized protein n=1 Tax=Pinibacter aurantiacus TaxID=2851599 RepID=A0A9E2W6T1_9BACT|nr:hypothetical protein [Pinibacter aurantiacus]MBV4360394.1 hypothetical protein [Pinibacter aurantiacus]
MIVLLQRMKVYNKIHLLVVIVSLVIIGACSSNIVLLKGKYSETPVEITSTKQVDSIWSTITQLFNEKGLTIKKLEKEKGLIVSTKSSSFIPAYTFEDNDGKLIEPQAWIVVRQTFINGKKWVPHNVFCQWNIQVTEVGKGLATIKVDPVVIYTWYPNMFTSMEDQGQSTGKLEELLLYYLGNK